MNVQIGPLGVLCLALIFLAIHAAAFIFKEFRVLPLFYTIVFISILIQMFVDWKKSRKS